MKWHQIQSSSRQTGRTMRMLEAAKKAYNEGMIVTIIASNMNHSRLLKERLGPKYKGINLCTPGSLGIGFSWRDLMLKGRRDQVFVDHFAIESNFHNILEELHKYDD